jgi:hypothetical protein
MSIQSNIIITKHMNRVLIALVTVATLVFAAAPMFAHGGFDHVMGTVVKVADNVLTVKTAKGNVDVKLDDKTELTQNNQKAQLSDLAPGARVVVDIPEGSKDKIAHSVKIGTAGKPVSHK